MLILFYQHKLHPSTRIFITCEGNKKILSCLLVFLLLLLSLVIMKTHQTLTSFEWPVQHFLLSSYYLNVNVISCRRRSVLCSPQKSNERVTLERFAALALGQEKNVDFLLFPIHLRRSTEESRLKFNVQHYNARNARIFRADKRRRERMWKQWKRTHSANSFLTLKPVKSSTLERLVWNCLTSGRGKHRRDYQLSSLRAM